MNQRVGAGKATPMTRINVSNLLLKYTARILLVVMLMIGLCACDAPPTQPVAVYPGAEFLRKTNSDRGYAQSSYFVTTDSPQDVLDFYRTTLPQDGWKFDADNADWMSFQRFVSEERSLSSIDLMVRVSLARDGRTSIELRQARNELELRLR